jgi:hypothetical protein
MELHNVESAKSEATAQLRQILCSSDLFVDSGYEYADSNIVYCYIVLGTLENLKNRTWRSIILSFSMYGCVWQKGIERNLFI